MKIQDFEKYDASKQIEKWNRVKDSLKIEEKENIIVDASSKNTDIWGYLGLISEILVDVASDSDKYIQILETLSSKIKNDMAQGPFLTALIRIGQYKTDTAIKLRKKIVEKSVDENLLALSGLILGGIGIKDRKSVLDMLIGNIAQEENPAVLQSYLKALLVMSEQQAKIDKASLQIINGLMDKGNEKVNIEILNFSLSNYKKNRTLFYGLIKRFISESNDIYKQFLFSRLSYQEIIEEKRLIELIEKSKNADEKVINEIVMCLRKYPSQGRKILNYYIHWINKGLYFKITNFDWVLEELSKKDTKLLLLFLKSFRKISKEHSYFAVPHIFETLAKNNIDLALSEAIRVKPRNKMEKIIKFKLFKVIIGYCYTNEINTPRIQKLARYLNGVAKNKPYMRGIKSELLDSNSLVKSKYDLLINQTSKLLSDLEVKKARYNYSTMRKNLRDYPQIQKYGKYVLDKCKKEKIYSPLLWLLEKDVPDTVRIEFEEKDNDFNRFVKTSFLRNQLWPKGYLNELNQGLLLFEQINNPKYGTQSQKKKYVQDMLINEEGFWRFFSELVFMNKVGKENILTKDIIFKNDAKTETKDIDFETKLFDKLIFFEVTAPDMDRNLRFSNGAVGLGNKSLSVIDKKYKQIMKTGIHSDPRYKDKFYFYVVIDISNSTIDEYDLINSLFGSLAFNWVIDKATHKTIKEYPSRLPDSIGHKNPKTEIIGGVIYFKRELVIDDGKIRIKLMGNVINNPNSNRILSESEVQKLKDILFM